MTEETQALVAEWGEAVYLSREDYTVDPHRHIERLVQRGDYLVDALTSLARDLETVRQERDALRAQFTAIGHVPYLDRMRELAAARDEAVAAVRAARAETLRELRRKIAEEASFVYEALLIIDRAAREGQ